MLNGYPVELLEEIFYYLPISDLVETAKINRRLNAVIGNKNNRSGKRLSGKNRVSVFVHFYDNLYRNNNSHGMVRYLHRFRVFYLKKKASFSMQFSEKISFKK